VNLDLFVGDGAKGWERKELSSEGKGNYPKRLWAGMGKN